MVYFRTKSLSTVVDNKTFCNIFSYVINHETIWCLFIYSDNLFTVYKIWKNIWKFFRKRLVLKILSIEIVNIFLNAY